MSQAREISDRFTAAINDHDADAIGMLFAEDGVFTEPAGEYRGREEIVRYWERFFAAFPDLSARDEFKAESGDTAINEWSVTGTNTGSLESPEGTLEPTGKRVTVRGCDALTVQGGLIRTHRGYYDQLTLLTQLGLVPEGAMAG